MTTNQQNQLDKVKELAEQIKVCMFTTTDANDYLRSRPMYTIKVEKDGRTSFFTDQFSDKVEEFQENRTVNLGYSDPSAQDFLSITGKATLSKDMKKIKELWSPMMKAWFPEGLESPRLSLVEVTPVSAEYWDSSSSKIVELFNMGKAILQGKRQDQVSNSDHATVDF